MDKKLLTAQTPRTEEFLEIPLKLIDDPHRPIRTDITRESLNELVRSIKQIGLIEPVIVKRIGERYEVIAGHRRTVASEFAGLPAIPCRIVTASDEQTEMMKIHENLYRTDISPIDEARHYDYLIQRQNLTPHKIADLISRSPQYIADRLAILSYDEELGRALEQGLINFSVAKEFSRVEEKSKLRQYLKYAIRSGLTAGVAKKWVDDLNKPVVPEQESAGTGPIINPTFGQKEETGNCFFCMQDVRLLEAQVVYVHDECVTARREIEEAKQDSSPPATQQ